MIYEDLIKDVAKRFIFIPIIAFFIIFFILNKQYHSDYYELKLNGYPMFAAYNETYERILIPRLFQTKFGYSGYLEPDSTNINRIKFNKNMTIDIKIISCYYKVDDKQTSCRDYYQKKDNKYNFIEQDTSNLKMTVSRKNKIIYDVLFKTDISDIITEPGRYYFVIVRNFKQESYSKGTYRINFNVIFEE